MPVYNQMQYVSDAVNSILAQTFVNFEFIIVDDGSTDGTPEILNNFTDPRIRIIRQQNGGFINALVTGYRAARGEWIARMDSDDLSHPTRLEKQYEFLAAHPECSFVGTAYGFATPNDRFVQPRKRFGWRFVDPAQITLGGRIFGDPTVMFHRATADRVGYYDDEFENENPLWYRLLRVKKGAVLGEILYYTRWRMGSVSRGGINQWTRDYYPLRKKYDPDNAAKIATRRAMNDTAINKQVKQGVAIYLRAGDRKAALRLAWSVWKSEPLSARRTKFLLYALLGIEGIRMAHLRYSAATLMRRPHPLLAHDLVDRTTRSREMFYSR
jgi:glycosyltransferase involved in cell wall biosynthesis